VDTPSPPLLGPFELLWAHAGQVTVAAGSIVEVIDVVATSFNAWRPSCGLGCFGIKCFCHATTASSRRVGR